MDTPLEESNLAFVGSDEDKAAKEAAAKLEVDWTDAGKSPGIQIWRVENTRDPETDTPNFGINKWPEQFYGEFYTGDSYIVLQTTQSEGSDNLLYDIYFWIGSDSTQDEYGVAAYKTAELDALLGDVPIQHREIEGFETQEFLNCFPNGNIKYLKGGIDSGFRHVSEDDKALDIPKRLFQVRKPSTGSSRETRSYLVPLTHESLNTGDAFVLDAGETIYTWYGPECSPFEKNKAVEVGHNLVESRGPSKCNLVVDVQEEDDESFWTALGGKGPVKEASEVTDDSMPSTSMNEKHDPIMYILFEDGPSLKIEKVDDTGTKKESQSVYLIDIGTTVYIWIGSSSSKREQSQATYIVQKQLVAMGRHKNTQVIRVIEGQESRLGGKHDIF